MHFPLRFLFSGKILIKKRKFKKSLFNAKIFRFKLKFFSKCPEIGKITIFKLHLYYFRLNSVIFG